MKRVGFVGLGTMGLPMASNLIKGGFEVVAYNRSLERTQTLRELGAQVARTPSEAVKSVDVVVTMLTDDRAVEQVCVGENGIAAACESGLIVLDCGTISPNTSRRMSKLFMEKGCLYLDAPVTGSEEQAQAGSLTFMVGGDKSAYEKCDALFNAMGKSHFYMGESGAGSYTKLANNTMVAIHLLALAEGITMVREANVDPELFIRIISEGGARSGMAEIKSPKIFRRDFSANFKSKLMLKDLGLAAQVSSDFELPTPALSIAREMMKMAVASGYGEEDMSAVVKCYEQWVSFK